MELNKKYITNGWDCVGVTIKMVYSVFMFGSGGEDTWTKSDFNDIRKPFNWLWQK